jgi:hypothetical protein
MPEAKAPRTWKPAPADPLLRLRKHAARYRTDLHLVFPDPPDEGLRGLREGVSTVAVSEWPGILFGR